MAMASTSHARLRSKPVRPPDPPRRLAAACEAPPPGPSCMSAQARAQSAGDHDAAAACAPSGSGGCVAREEREPKKQQCL